PLVGTIAVAKKPEQDPLESGWVALAALQERANLRCTQVSVRLDEASKSDRRGLWILVVGTPAHQGGQASSRRFHEQPCPQRGDQPPETQIGAPQDLVSYLENCDLDFFFSCVRPEARHDDANDASFVPRARSIQRRDQLLHSIRAGDPQDRAQAFHEA